MKTNRVLLISALVLVAASTVLAATVSKTMMFRSPYGDGVTMFKMRDNNQMMTPVTGMSGWFSKTFSWDNAGQVPWEVGQGFFIQPCTGTNTCNNECYDPQGKTTTDQNCKQKFPAPSAWTGDTLWVIPDVATSALVPIMSAAAPRRVYLLNPDDWVQGMPLLQFNGTTSAMMLPDPDRCGWFYKDLFVENGPFTSALFQFDMDAEDLIGMAGLGFDASPINLDHLFDSLSSTTIWFDPNDGSWSSTDPQVDGICGYDLAAIIRDFHHSTHPNFYLPADADYFSYSGFTLNGSSPDLSGSWTDKTGTARSYTYTNSPRGYGSRNPCEEIKGGIVMSTLGSDKLPVYNESSNCFGKPAGTDGKKWFDWLFRTDTLGQAHGYPAGVANINKEHCADLRFSKTVDGLWEFDTQNLPDKGYFPLEKTGALGLETEAPYNITAPSQCGAPLELACEPYYDTLTAAQVMAGPGSVGCKTGTSVSDWWYWGGRSCTQNNFWSKGYDGSGHEAYAPRNQHFCFESHATFIYSPGQTFKFRGDDDIWVFINNQLVVDNGGLHLPAPGFVKLENLGLNAGGTYDIDIFFCDRQPTSSNVRIKTNMYFEQKKTLYWKATAGPTGTVYTLEKLQTGGSSCAALKTNQTDVIIPGSDLDLVYTLVSTRGETMDGDPTTPAFLDSNLVTGVKVYGGIMINNGAVTLDTTKLSGLPPGRYRIVIYEKGSPGAKTTITFKISGNTGFYSVKRSQATLTQRPAVDTLAGRLVPFEVAKMFDNMLDASEASFILTIPDGLQVYRDSLGTQPVGAGVAISTNDDGTIDDGVITLWATGSRKTAADTVTYMLQIKGSKNPPLYLKYHQPRLAFVADSTSLTPLGNPKPSLGVDQGNFAFVNIPTYMIAYDPADGSLCLDCNDTLIATTSDSLSFTALDGGAVLSMKKGRIVIRVRGYGNVTAGSFVVDGPTPWMTDNWTNINLERPPVPVPTFAGMFDRNADGIADSLHITFDRSIRDTMPDFLVIRWPSSAPDTLVLQGKTRVLLDRTTSDTLLEPFFPAENANQVINLLTTDGLNFSYNFAYDQIDTRSLGQVDAWFTFQNKSGQIFQQPITADIEDKMAPIVAKVRIKIAQGGQLFDTLRVAFSEPIDTAGFYSGLTPFEFRELAILDGLTPHAVPAQITVMRPSLDTMLLLYNKDVQHPRAGDSLRISILASDFVVKDVRGNPRSLSNPFVLIEGDKRNELVTLHYVVLDPKTAEKRTQSKSPVFIDKVGIYDDLDKVTSYLNTQHGAVLGHIVKTDLSEVFSKYAATYQVRAGKPLTPADVVLHYETSYHTSIGGFVASSKGSVSCADTLFGGNCNSNQNGYVFVGWNLTSNDHRLVGTGAYVARIRTWVNIPVLGKISETTLTKDRIWGVMRKSGIINK